MALPFFLKELVLVTSATTFVFMILIASDCSADAKLSIGLANIWLELWQKKRLVAILVVAFSLAWIPFEFKLLP